MTRDEMIHRLHTLKVIANRYATTPDGEALDQALAELTAKDAAPSSPSVEQAIILLNLRIQEWGAQIAAQSHKRLNLTTGPAVDAARDALIATVLAESHPKASPSVEQAKDAIQHRFMYGLEGDEEHRAPTLASDTGLIDALIASVRAERNNALQATIDRLTTINQRLEAEITAFAGRPSTHGTEARPVSGDHDGDGDTSVNSARCIGGDDLHAIKHLSGTPKEIEVATPPLDPIPGFDIDGDAIVAERSGRVFQCSCLHSDARRCARAMNQGGIACQCACHCYTTSMERIHRAAYAAVAHAIEADLPADVAANLAVAREVLTILKAQIQSEYDHFTTATDDVAYGARSGLQNVMVRIEFLRAELTPSEDRS